MELIDKRVAYDALKKEAEMHELPFTREAYERAARIIDQMYVYKNEAEPVRHGRWVYADVIGGMKYYRCTNCENHGNECLADENEIQWFKYCPRCGANMREGKQDG